MSNQLLVDIENLSKTYQVLDQTFSILSNLKFQVFKGEIVSIEGASGVGKSTLLNIIGALDDFDSGKVMVCGENLFKISERKKEIFRATKISLIFQSHLLLPDFTALENVMIPLLIEGKTKSVATGLALDILNRVGLKDRALSYPSQLSGGESARVGVARALVNGKELVLADEPTGNLDRENSKNLMNLITDLQKEYKFSLILVTHDMELAGLASKRNKMLGGVLTPIS